MARLAEIPWIKVARSYIGVAEIKGPHHDPHIVKWWRDIGAPFRDDETPWCGAFVGGVLCESGIKPVKGGATARNWLKLPVKLTKPAYGCVVVFWRGDRQGSAGHVGFVVGKYADGRLAVLGGNQNDRVIIKPFDTSQLLGYRWPGIYPREERFALPLISGKGQGAAQPKVE